MASTAVPTPPTRREARRDGQGAAKTPARGAGAASAQGEFERLASLLEALLVRFAALREENAALGGELHARADRIAVLEAEVQRMQEARSEVGMRIDELIAQIDQLEGRLVAQAEIP